MAASAASAAAASTAATGSTTGRDVALQVLATDAGFRVPGVTDDLHRLDLVTQQDWDYSLPTLVRSNNVFLKSKIKSTTSEGFRTKFFDMYPELQGLDWSHIFVAGGSVGRHIYSNQAVSNDVDLFIFGVTPAEANGVVQHICDTIVKFKATRAAEEYNRALERGETPSMHGAKFQSRNRWRQQQQTPAYKTAFVDESRKPLTAADYKEEDLDISYSRTANALTILSKYQVVFRLYSSPSEILHGFDLGSSAVGFDGEHVWVTTLGKFAYEYGCNIVDTTRRSTSYEHRLQKYLQRGFEIVLPQLDIAQFPVSLWERFGIEQVCELPFMHFTYTDREGNKILMSRFFPEKKQLGDGSSATTDYDNYDDDGNEFSLFFRNMSRLLKRQFNRIVYLGNESKQVLQTPACFTKARIEYFYRQLLAKIGDADFPATTVERYFTLVDDVDIFKARKDRQKLQEIVAAQTDEALRLMAELAAQDTTIPWITDNPGTQLTGSFNPIFKEPKDWYGKYLVEKQ